MQNLDLNKANGHDMISLRMLRICGKSLNEIYPNYL